MGSTGLSFLTKALAVLIAGALAACGPDDAVRPEVREKAPPPGRARFDYADWYDVRRETAIAWGTYDEILAVDMDEPDDGARKRCPDVPPLSVITRTWRLSLKAEQLPGPEDSEYLAHFAFDGPKLFIQYIGTASNGLPLADYRYIENAETPDGRWVALANGRLTLMCNGTVFRARGIRAWRGSYWVVAHEGRIVPGPAYAPPSDCGGGGAGVDQADDSPYSEDYDPYSPGEAYSSESEGGGGCGGRDGGQGSDGDDDEDGTPVPVWEGGGGEVCNGDSQMYYEEICIDVWTEGVGWVEWWCGVAAICG